MSRNEDLRNAFRNQLGHNRNSVKQVFEAVARFSPARRFYISEERAYRLLTAYRRGKVSPVAMPNRVEMIREIDRRVTALMTQHPKTALKDAVFEVVNSPAPSFYLTPGSIRTIFYTL